jgi:molybdopterin/thiamine biosynthesis adenylyltransferase
METKPQIIMSKAELPEGVRVVENLNDSLEELFFIEHPQFKKRTPENTDQIDHFIQEHISEECWIYFSWKALVIHTVSEAIYFKLRTSRNRNIITTEEQEKYRMLAVGIAGLSVGSAVLQALVMSGGPRSIKIADFDVLEVTNLNRLRADLTDIGENKTHIAARKVWELDPFAELTLFDKGVNRENLTDFLFTGPRLDIFIDEMDSIDLKIMARQICRKNKIPVLMATDNGDGIILDVERFDLEPERELFHGLIPEMDPEALRSLDFKQWFRLATKIVGPEYLTEAMQDSLAGLGKEIPSVPQLGTSASMAGSAMSFAVRKMATGMPMPSGRYTIGLEEKLIPGYDDAAQAERRKKKTDEFIAALSKQT